MPTPLPPVTTPEPTVMPTPLPPVTPTPEPTPEPTPDPLDPSNFPVPDRTLKKGSTGEDVKWLQAALRKLGYPAEVDGVFGEETFEALKTFQQDHGLTVDGICGPATRTALIEALGAVVPPPPLILLGDVDLDGRYTTRDALMILRHALEIELLPDEVLSRADVVRDGSINTGDALYALRISLNILPPPNQIV
jgi:hypothetical protein